MENYMQVLTHKNEVLYEGTKEDCLHFVKRRCLTRNEFKLRTPHHTTAPIAPKGNFLKRIFKRK